MASVLALALADDAGDVACRCDRRRQSDFVKVGYFLQWGIYGRSFFAHNLEDNGTAGRLTHINYAFGNVAPDADGDIVCSSGDPWADYQRPFPAAEDVNGVDEAGRRCSATSTS